MFHKLGSLGKLGYELWIIKWQQYFTCVNNITMVHLGLCSTVYTISMHGWQRINKECLLSSAITAKTSIFKLSHLCQISEIHIIIYNHGADLHLFTEYCANFPYMYRDGSRKRTVCIIHTRSTPELLQAAQGDGRTFPGFFPYLLMLPPYDCV